ncbi:interleukin-2 receptor subunit beta-like isoform X1 [Seriola lalandi dorsalis]|uniref:interleukin-2 receptor subunit beta-like isoform X1 n=1 Tax=Seriola lalandi dorsalis TaxID=1841481 RepID=UPI000C6F7BE6|nr:interleukin-2 receptor subunit beta-like isoform X1 [Seriola lalandi dorsalis]
MAVEMLWTLFILPLCSAHAARSQNGSQGSQGLSCVNDFVNNVSCTWNSTAAAPGLDCWIHGVKKIWKVESNRRVPELIGQSCKLRQQGASPPGCSFVFENQEFDFYDVMPNISVKCNGKLLEILTDYEPCEHIKLNPPGVPNVRSTANETWISWSPGSPLSDYIVTFDFQIQIKLEKQTWKEASTLFTQAKDLRIPAWQLKGHSQVRARVKSSGEHCDSLWSNWSPTTSWLGAPDVASQDQGWFLDHTLLVVQGVVLSTGLFVVVLLLYMSWLCRRRLKKKEVPNPSKYFPTLHPVHGGNLKKWLNPLSASESFFTAQPCDHISPVELCESWDVVPSTSPSTSSTCALLHSRSYPTAGSDTSGVVDNSSSSSSCFSNLGYFMSNASSGLARTDPGPAYFTYQDDFHNLHDNLHFSLCPSFTGLRVYESLKREPQSPDSGFGIGQEDEKGKEDEKGVRVEEGSDDRQSSPLLILPLHLSSWACPPSSPPPPPHPPSLTQIRSDSQEVDDEPEAATGESYAAWPVAGSMCRSSSMPVEPCKTGYLTLKELQTTFSNKSI